MNKDYSKALETMSQALEDTKDRFGFENSVYDEFVKKEAHGLKMAAPFFWNHETAGAVRAAASSIPKEAMLSHWNLPIDAAWWYFETPVFRSPTVHHGVRENVPCRALLMFWQADSFYIAPWAESKKMPGKLFPCGMMFWPIGHTLDNINHAKALDVNDGKIIESAQDIGMFSEEPPFVLAALAWMEQKIVSAETTQIHRARRREFERKHDIKPADVRVVQLRRSEAAKAETVDASDMTERKYFVRWVVDGHWRNQPCGFKRAERRLTWIAPYLKGPDDMPLKEKPQKLFAVVR